MTDHTHDPSARSWLAPDGPAAGMSVFTIQRLPIGVFSTDRDRDPPRPGIGIGDRVLDLAAVARYGLIDDIDAPIGAALRAPSLNPLLAHASEHWSALRHRMFALLVDDEGGWRAARDVVRQCLVPMSGVRMHLPVGIGDYTDFYASIHHATNVGTMLRPDQPLYPNYRHVPIGYHGRASSIVVSGTPITRPSGQRLPHGASAPIVGPSERLDYELEIGMVMGGENALGETEPVSRALARVFGLVLLNDWSARDIQAWEYQPLGPFLGKSFATTISAWVVPIEALADRRVAAPDRGPDAPPLQPYLVDAADQATGAFDLPLEVHLSSAAMRRDGQRSLLVSRSNMRDLYWTPAQLIAHHTSNGCNLRPGDLIATGTVSGATPDSRGCLLERTWRGAEPLALPNGEVRRFLEDGDEVLLTSPLLGECRGAIRATPA